MNKVIRKLRPSDYWRIGEHECWFADMAAEGVHLKKMGLYFAQFVRDEPKQMRYRIDVSLNRTITTEQKWMYAENGWDFVTSYGDFNVFSSPDELNAPELHTDSAEQAYTLKELDERFARSSLLVIVAVVLIIGMIAAAWFLNRSPIIYLIEGSMIQQVIIIFVELYVAYTSLQAAVSIRTLRKTLSEGKPINHNAPWKRHQRITAIVGIIFIVFVIFGSILPFVQILRKETKTLPFTHIDLPIIRLADVEQNSNLVRKNSIYIPDNVDWSNYYSYDWSLLAPVQYESDEQGVVPNEMWKDGSGVYSPSIHTRIYQLSIPSMAESLINNLIKRDSNEFRGGEFIETEHADFDILVIHEVDERKEVFAAQGKVVMYVRYFGYIDINSMIREIANKTTLFSN